MRRQPNRIHTSHTSDLTTHRDGSGHRLHTARIVVAVDLSAVIFVVLALAWAAYLIPKALKHHDDMASDRLIEGHSDKVRILSRKARAAAAEVADAVTPAVSKPTYDAASDPGYPTRKAATPEPEPVVAPGISRATARKAAQRRRRVLGVLVLALVAVWALTWFAYLPIWAPGAPGALVLAWLVIARLSVRKQQRRRRIAPPVPADEVVAPAPAAAPAAAPARAERVETPAFASNADDFLDQLADEDTAGLAREEIEEALASEGSLWDPLPMTLPTYVSKARARRTVRTIELTGISSSGHDETDSSLAREAAESAQESARADEETAARRKAAGA